MANERMINTVSCAVVFVEGQGNYAIPPDEQRFVLAKIQDGVERITDYEPSSNVSVTYSTTSVELPPFDMYDGAEFVGLPQTYYTGFDAALWNKLNSKIYFFQKGEYIRIDPNNGMTMDPGYPQPIASTAQGIPDSFSESLDAVIWDHNRDKVYYFKGAEFISVDPNNGWAMDSGYPQLITSVISNLPNAFAGGVDAGIWAKNNKVILFKDDQHVVVDPNNNWLVEPGYPKPIRAEIQGMSAAYNNGISAAFMNGNDDKIYLFKNQSKVGNFFRIDPSNGMTADTNKAINTGLGWGFEEVWRNPAQAALNHGPGKTGAYALSDTIQNRVGTQFGFVVFVTKFPTAWHGYVNGRKMILRKGGADRRAASFENWGGLHRTFAHELGHIFGAHDEYGGCTCNKKQGKFLRVINGNCVNCPPPIQDCIMKSSSKNTICDYSRQAVGWWAFLDGIDASFYHFHDQQHYVFSKDYFIRFSRNLSMKTDYAQHVSDLWPTLNMDLSDGFDASFWNENDDKLYFFKGDQYLRITPSNGWNPDPNFPIPIAGNLRIPANYHDSIDAAMWNGKDTLVVMFKGAELILVDPVSWSTVPGYPQPINQFFQGLPIRFAQGIDSALWSQVNNCVYLFKNGKYVKVDPHNNWTVEPGYPKWIDSNWDMAFPKIP